MTLVEENLEPVHWIKEEKQWKHYSQYKNSQSKDSIRHVLRTHELYCCIIVHEMSNPGAVYIVQFCRYDQVTRGAYELQIREKNKSSKSVDY